MLLHFVNWTWQYGTSLWKESWTVLSDLSDAIFTLGFMKTNLSVEVRGIQTTNQRKDVHVRTAVCNNFALVKLVFGLQKWQQPTTPACECTRQAVSEHKTKLKWAREGRSLSQSHLNPCCALNYTQLQWSRLSWRTVQWQVWTAVAVQYAASLHQLHLPVITASLSVTRPGDLSLLAHSPSLSLSLSSHGRGALQK